MYQSPLLMEADRSPSGGDAWVLPLCPQQTGAPSGRRAQTCPLQCLHRCQAAFLYATAASSMINRRTTPPTTATMARVVRELGFSTRVLPYSSVRTI